MRFRVSQNPALCLFTLEQLREIAASLVVETGCGVIETTWSQSPPANTTLPWQPLDSCGIPMGTVRIFKNGEWK